MKTLVAGTCNKETDALETVHGSYFTTVLFNKQAEHGVVGFKLSLQLRTVNFHSLSSSNLPSTISVRILKQLTVFSQDTTGLSRSLTETGIRIDTTFTIQANENISKRVEKSSEGTRTARQRWREGPLVFFLR